MNSYLLRKKNVRNNIRKEIDTGFSKSASEETPKYQQRSFSKIDNDKKMKEASRKTLLTKTQIQARRCIFT